MQRTTIPATIATAGSAGALTDGEENANRRKTMRIA